MAFEFAPQNMGEAAAGLHEWYLSFLDAGFEDQQAMFMIAILLGARVDLPPALDTRIDEVFGRLDEED